jgi:hypothetical protein
MKTFIIPLLVCLLVILPTGLWAQSVSLNTDGSEAHASAILDVKSTSKGMLVPRMTSAERSGIVNPALGLLVFDTDRNTFWFYDDNAWVEIISNPGGGLNTGMTLSNATLELTDAGGTLSTDLSPLIDDADADPANELQNWGNLPGIPSDIADGDDVNDADADPTNELQNWNNLPGIPSDIVDGDDVNDGDADPTNEIQTLSIAGNVISLNNGGGAVTLGTQTLVQDADQDTKIQVEESADEDKIRFDLAGNEKMVLRRNPNGHAMLELNLGLSNIFIGQNSGGSNTVGTGNTVVGSYSMINNTVGSDNTAIGWEALSLNTGTSNTATGSGALKSNTTGLGNTANGVDALQKNTTGEFNTGIGWGALFFNTLGERNTALGHGALWFNTTGDYNTAIGSDALEANQTGQRITAIGFEALNVNTVSDNTALGYKALRGNTTGLENTAAGFEALHGNTTNDKNTAFGYKSLSNSTGTANTAIGASSGHNIVNGSYNTFLGNYTGFHNSSNTWTNSTAIGNAAVITGTDQVRLGNSMVWSIGGYANWTNLSDGDYKKNISEDIKGLEFITRLRPVSYQLDMDKLATTLREDYVSDANGSEVYQTPDAVTLESRRKKGQVRHTGFVAQEVETTARELGFEFSGVDKPQTEDGLYGLRYSEFVVPLVKAVQEQQAIIEQLQQRIEALEKASQ